MGEGGGTETLDYLKSMCLLSYNVGGELLPNPGSHRMPANLAGTKQNTCMTMALDVGGVVNPPYLSK